MSLRIFSMLDIVLPPLQCKLTDSEETNRVKHESQATISTSTALALNLKWSRMLVVTTK